MSLKQRDIKPCLGCGRGAFHDNHLAAFTVSITSEILNVPAVQRQHGLEMMMGGNALIANVMGRDEDMTKTLGDPVKGLVCMDCAMTMPLAQLLELGERTTATAAEGR